MRLLAAFFPEATPWTLSSSPSISLTSSGTSSYVSILLSSEFVRPAVVTVPVSSSASLYNVSSLFSSVGLPLRYHNARSPLSGNFCRHVVSITWKCRITSRFVHNDYLSRHFISKSIEIVSFRPVGHVVVHDRSRTTTYHITPQLHVIPLRILHALPRSPRAT